VTRDDAVAVEGLESLYKTYRYGKEIDVALKALAEHADREPELFKDGSSVPDDAVARLAEGFRLEGGDRNHLETLRENFQCPTETDQLLEKAKHIRMDRNHLGAPVSNEARGTSRSPLTTSVQGKRADLLLHKNMMRSLESATTYAWAPHVVETVATAAESLSPETVMSPFAIEELAPSAWWFFQKPIPIQSVKAVGEKMPTVAMLTTKLQPYGEVKREWSGDDGSGLWFQTFVPHAADGYGTVAIPGGSWFWANGRPVGDLLQHFKEQYESVEYLEKTNLVGQEVTCNHAYWFCRFTIAAASWLRQRVLAREQGRGNRGVRRRIMRERPLQNAPPTVEVIKLRRTEVSETGPSNPDAVARHYQMRFIVHGHWRNQWYAKAGVHAPKWIESYIKGPVDKPLKDAARVYSVSR
jgi:hypothetical protein